MNLHPRLSRTARLVLIGGLATGAGFGAMAAVNAATSPSPSASASPGTGGNTAGPHHGFGHDGRGHFGGGGGTITSISGTTLTLRTENGTQTVTTTSSTVFTKERQTIKLSDLAVGDVVHVMAASAPAAGTTPGTGTIAATSVMVVEPALGGRVTSISGDTVNLVGRDGRLFTVTLTGSTVYYNGRSSGQRSDLTTGSHIMAEGAQDSLTHLTADDVVILPSTPPAGGPDGGRPDFGGPGGPGGPGAPGAPGGADFPGPPDGSGGASGSA